MKKSLFKGLAAALACLSTCETVKADNTPVNQLVDSSTLPDEAEVVDADGNAVDEDFFYNLKEGKYNVYIGGIIVGVLVVTGVGLYTYHNFYTSSSTSSGSGNRSGSCESNSLSKNNQEDNNKKYSTPSYISEPDYKPEKQETLGEAVRKCLYENCQACELVEYDLKNFLTVGTEVMRLLYDPKYQKYYGYDLAEKEKKKKPRCIDEVKMRLNNFVKTANKIMKSHCTERMDPLIKETINGYIRTIGNFSNWQLWGNASAIFPSTNCDYVEDVVSALMTSLCTPENSKIPNKGLANLEVELENKGDLRKKYAYGFKVMFRWDEGAPKVVVKSTLLLNSPEFTVFEAEDPDKVLPN